MWTLEIGPNLGWTLLGVSLIWAIAWYKRNTWE